MPSSSLLQSVLRMCVKIWSLLRPDGNDHVRNDEDGDDNGNDDDDGGDDDCVEIGCGWRGADLKSYQPWGTGVREWSWCAPKTKLFYQKGKSHLQFCWTNAAPSLAEELTSLKLIFCKTFHTSWIEKPESNVNTKFLHQIFFTYNYSAPYKGFYACYTRKRFLHQIFFVESVKVLNALGPLCLWQYLHDLLPPTTFCIWFFSHKIFFAPNDYFWKECVIFVEQNK